MPECPAPPSAGATWPECSPDDVEEQVLAARGAAADVYRGVLVVAGVRTPVALRRPRITSAAALERFEAEVSLRARVRHPALLPLLAACTAAPRYATVAPWLAGGDACAAVHGRGARFGFARLLRLAAQLARGMAALHAAGLVHRDLKTANILLDRTLQHAVVADLDLVASVSDLARDARVANGRALQRGPSNGRLAHMVGTLAYLAPEVLQGAPHGFPADVYAYAVTLNELAAAAVPYVDRELPEPELHTVLESRFNDMSLRRAIVKDGLRPVSATGVPEEFKELVERGWASDPAQRPTFEEIIHVLDGLRARGEEFVNSFPASVGKHEPKSADAMDESGDFVNNSAELLAELQKCRISASPPVWGAYRAASGVVPPLVDGALSSTCGERGPDRMEDTAIVCQNLADMEHTHLFGVFDGHGGARCSQFAAETLPAAIFRNWSSSNTDPVSVLVRAFQDTDAAFLSSTDSSEQSGCTALAVLMLGSSAFVANAGDCRCVLATTDGVCHVITKDHLATDTDERSKIEARGGIVDPNSGRVQGRLAVSRAIGDRALKRYVSATPDVFAVELSPLHDFFILASDGLWDVVSSAEAVSLVRSTVRKADLAAKRLALKAIELGSDDNISVIVVFFDPQSLSLR